MALANYKNTEITAHFRYARKFLLHYRYDAHKPLRERQNAGFFTASLEVVPSQTLFTLQWAGSHFSPQWPVLSVLKNRHQSLPYSLDLTLYLTLNTMYIQYHYHD